MGMFDDLIPRQNAAGAPQGVPQTVPRTTRGMFDDLIPPPMPDVSGIKPPESPYVGLPEPAPQEADQQQQPQEAMPPATKPKGMFDDLIPPETTAGDYTEAFGKSFVKGGAALLGSVPKETAATVQSFNRRQIPIMDKIDRGEAVSETEDVLGYQHMTPEQRQEFRAKFVPAATKPVKGTSWYQAGQKIEESGQFKMPAGFEGQTWTTDIGAGLGSMTAGMGLALIPFVGSQAAGTAFLMSGRQEARERAAQAGMSLEMQDRAAQLGTVAGATDLMDIVILKTGTIGKAVGLIKKVGLKAIESAFIEGAQEGVQEFIQNAIEKGLYNPKKDLGENVPRSVAVGMILGVGAGGAIGYAQEKLGGKEGEPRKPLTDEQMAKAYENLTGQTLDAAAPPPTVQPGFVRAFQIVNADGSETTTLDPAVAKEQQKTAQVGWVDIPESDPGAQTLKLSPEQRAAVTPMATAEQQLQAMQVLNVAQNEANIVSEPQHGRGNVAEALGGPEVPGRVVDEYEGSTIKLSPERVLTTDVNQAQLLVTINKLTKKLEENKAKFDELKIKTGVMGPLGMAPTATPAELKELERLDHEGVSINNAIRQLTGALRDERGIPKPDASASARAGRFTSLNEGLLIDPAVVQAAQGQKIGDPKSNLEANAIGMAVAVQRVAQKFGIRSKITFEVHEGLLEGPNSLGTAGIATNLFNGRFRIIISLASIKHRFAGNEVLATQTILMHELGHVLMYERWSNATTTQKKLIQQAYEDFRKEITPDSVRRDVYVRRFNAVQMFQSRSDPRMNDRIKDFAQEGRQYYIGFSEWFAEQVARWGMTNERPLTIVEKYFKGIADAMHAVWAEVIKHFTGTKYEKETFKASKVMEEWLNHFIDHAPELSQDIYTEMQLKEIEANGKVLPPGVPALPMPPAIATVHATVQKVIPAGTPIGPGNQPPQSPPPPPPPPPGGPGGAQPGGPARAQAQAAAVHASRINWLYRLTAGLSQLAASNPFFTPLLRYAEKVRQAHIVEARIQEESTRVAKAWRKLRGQSENLVALIDDITNMRYIPVPQRAAGVARHPTLAEFNNLLRQHQVSQEALVVFNQIKNMFSVFLQLNRQEAIATASRIFANDPTKLLQKITEINAEFAKMAARPYFPFMRFGSYYVMVKDAAGKAVHFSTYERVGLKSAKAVQAQARSRIAAQLNPGETISEGKLPEVAEPFIGMPPALLEMIHANMVLTPQQQDALKDLILASSPAMSFKHNMQRKDYVPGYSMDFRRAFARYFFHGARYYSRTKYAWEMRELLKQARGHGTKGDEIADFMDDHFQKAIIDVRGDFGLLRGAAFLYVMGYVPAAATQNLTQIPMIALPYMTSRFGPRAAWALMASMKQLDNYYKKGNLVDSLKQFRAGNPGVSFFVAALGYGVQTGRISEAQAADLAGMAGGGNLVAGIGGNRFERGFVQFQEKGAWMFETAEQFNRRVVYRAALELALAKPNSRGVREAVSKYNAEYQELVNSRHFSPAQAAAIVTAAHTVDQTQFVYARYDRPKMMRGPIGATVLVFQRYLQSLIWLLAQNKKDVLPMYLLVAAAIGGMSGMPGYEDLREIIKALMARMYGKHFNLDNMIKRYVLDSLGGRVDPDLVLHGFARKGFGVPALLDMFGSFFTGNPGRGLDSAIFHSRNIPSPLFDRTRALTSGHILPFELGKLFYPQKASEMSSTIAEQTQKASGAIWSTAFNMYKMLTDSQLSWSDPKRYERAMPRQAAAIASTLRKVYEGRERSRAAPNAASTTVRYDWTDPEHAMELIGNAMGYRPLRESQFWDNQMQKKEAEAFHDFMKERLLGQFFEAVRGQNKEERETVLDEIKRYNEQLRKDGLPARQLTRDTIMQSVQKRQEILQKKEMGIPLKRQNIQIEKQVDELYPRETYRPAPR